jgi:hypothetical protein
MTSFRYFRPTSLSWWVGVISFLVGAAQILYPENERFTGVGLCWLPSRDQADLRPC